MKKLISILAVGMALTACNISIEEYAKQQAEAFTQKNCPSPVKNNIRTDSLVYEENTRTLHYYYSLFNELDNSDSLVGRSDGMRERLLDALKNSTTMEQFKQAEMTFKYTYHSSTNPDSVLYEVAFNSSVYNK